MKYLMTKKVYKNKFFFFVITKNLNWENLTRNLVIFKRWDGFNDKKKLILWRSPKTSDF